MKEESWIPKDLLDLYLKGLIDFDDLRHHALIRNLDNFKSKKEEEKGDTND